MSPDKSEAKDPSPELEVDKDGEEKQDEEEDEEEEVYQVEVITKARVIEYEDGTVDWEYFIKWANYPDSESSWEPKVNVKSCERLLDSFWDHVGHDDKDYADGYQVEAKKWWIRKEKEYFKNSSEKQIEAEEQEGQFEKHGTEEEDKLKGDISRKGQSKQQAIITIDTSDDEDEPLITLVNRPKSKVSKRENDHSADCEDRPAKLQKNHSKSDVGNVLSSYKGNITKSAGDQNSISLFSDPDLSPEAPVAVPQSILPHSKTVSKPTPAAQPTTFSTKRIAIAMRGVPLHRQRQNNPQVKMLDLPSANVSRGSGLSTKSRIAQNSLVTPGTKFASTGRKSTLSSLSFKKYPKKLAESRVEVKQAMPEPGMSRNSTIQTSTHDIDMPDLPEPAPAPGVNSNLPSPMQEDPPESMLETFPTPEVDNRGSEVDSFLASVMPQGLSEPIRPIHKEKELEPRIGIIRKVKPADMMKIPKKWKWSGELFTNVSADKAERFCDVTIQDTTDSKPDGLRFSLFFQKNDSIRLKKMHDVADLNMILPSCGVIHQLARLVPQDEKYKSTLNTLSKYMFSERKFSYSPLSFVNEVKVDTDVVALMLVFPPFDDLCNKFNVPEDMRQDDGLLVALIPLKLRSEKYRKLQWRKLSLPAVQRTDGEHITLPDRLLRGDPVYVRALRLLHFPRWLYDFIPRREYCVWFAPVDGTEEASGTKIKARTETQALLTVLNRNKATNVGYRTFYNGHKTHLRIIFVHVGALDTLYRLPLFCDRRYQHPELQIVTYGSHPTVPPDRWGIHQIYVVGGIVTFTPNAIIKDPLGIQWLIEKIDEHPFFACYLLPAVIGLAMRMAEDTGDAGLCQFISEDLFTLIYDGRVALLDAPSMDLHPMPTPDRKHAWTNLKTSLSLREPSNLLAECQALECANLPSPACQTAIMEKISNDMLSMQLQPTIMDNYRRFIVITDAADEIIRNRAKGSQVGDSPKDEGVRDPSQWLEWHTLSTFEFKDDFHE